MSRGGKEELYPLLSTVMLKCLQANQFLTLSWTLERLKNDKYSLSVNTVSIGVCNTSPERGLNEKKNQIFAVSKGVILKR